MFGGTLCSNRHGFYRQAELGNRLCTYVASVRSVGSSVLCAVSGKACNYVLAPCLSTYMQGNGQSQERRWQRTDGRRVGGFRRRTYPKYVRGVAHTYIARRSSPALPPSTLIIA